MRYWKRIDKEGKITTVESYSHELDVKGAVEITQQKFDTYMVSLPVVPSVLPRDLAKEIDGLKADIEELKKST